MPWKLLRSLKFVTPASASAPYTAEAPPVMISTLSSAAAGMEFVSMTSVELTGCARRPSISTSVRFAPRPRRLMEETPGVLVALGNTSEVLNCVCVVGTYCGSWFSTDSTAMVLDS